MDRAEALEKLKFLYDQVHQTAERAEHLEERMPLHVHPQSLNYERDLSRVKGEYNRLARELQERGISLDYEGLPAQFDQHNE